MGSIRTESEYAVLDQSCENCWILPYYAQDKVGNTRLHECMILAPQYDDFAKKLIDETWPASLLNIQNNEGKTALHLAAIGNQSDIVRKLLLAGANPLAKDKQGYIPLHLACQLGNDDAIVPLTKAFNDQEITEMQSKNLTVPNLSPTIYEENNKGQTPFHLAIKFGHDEIVKLFFKP
nr:ORF65 [Bracoviriform inaniti]